MNTKLTRKPSKFYKYQNLSLHGLLNLKKQVIFFGSPKYFNDPYDCALFPQITEPSDEDLKYLVRLSEDHKDSEFLANLVASTQNENTRFWRGSRSKEKFKVEFNEIG